MKNQEMKEGKIVPLLIKFSTPAVIGMLVNAIYNVVDRIFIGNAPDLGALGLAGATVSYPVMLVLIALSLMSGVGGSTRFSIALGAGNKEEAKQYLANSFIISILVGILFMLFGNLFLNQILQILGASNQSLPYAREYLSIILYGAVFQCIAMWGNNFSRAQGNPKNAMISQLIGAGFNILFDYIFIYIFDMGMAGAAWATIGGQFLSCIWQLNFIFGRKSIVQLRLKEIKIKLHYVKTICSTGIPALLMQLANSTQIMVLNGTVASLGGDVAVSTVGVITSFQSILTMPIMGICQGQQPLISYNYGAKLIDRVYETYRNAVIGATIFAIVGYVCILTFPEAIIRLFSSDTAIIELGVQAMKIWFMASFLIGYQVVCANYFQAVGRIKAASFYNLIRQFLFLIPIMLILSKIFGLFGVFYAVVASDVLATLVTFIAMKKEVKALKTQFK